MWLFVKPEEKKTRPVLGITLSKNKLEQPKIKIKNAIQLFDALFTTMKDAHDARYISRKHEKDIIFIPCEKILPIDFEISNDIKAKMIETGRNKTVEFLKKWNY